MKYKFFLICTPYLHDRGLKLNIESDIFFYLAKCFGQNSTDFETAKFHIKDTNQMILDLQNLQDKLSQNTIVVVDGCYYPGDKTGIYPKELANTLEKSKAKIVCILSDLVKELNFSPWVKISNFILSFSKTGCEWANRYYNTNKFIHYPSIPVPCQNENSIQKFLNRPYDFGYVGSKKIFRMNFLNSLIKKSKKQISTMIIDSNRSMKTASNTESYLKLLKQCRFFFCTRAAYYEKYSNSFLNSKIFDGRYAGRISESIACGCIPIYWQPKRGGYLLTMLKNKIFFSRKSHLLNFKCLKSDKESVPFDSIDKKKINCVEFVNDADHAINLIKNYSIEDTKIKLENGLKFYSNYIDPKIFFDFILKNIEEKN